jgi:chaperone required for assembly of F1-ATPase
MCDELKSVIIALALWKGNISVEQAVEAANVEELYQREIFGHIMGAHDVEMTITQAKLSAATLYLSLLHHHQNTGHQPSSNLK